MESFDVRPVAGGTVEAVAAARPAGRPAVGALGVALGAAGDFVRRQKALQAQLRARPDDGDGPDDDLPPPRLTMIVGEGVTVRG